MTSREGLVVHKDGQSVPVTLTPTIVGPSTASRTQTQTFILGTTSNVFMPVTYSIDWGDGVLEMVSGLEGTQARHLFQRLGTLTIRVVAMQNGVASGRGPLG